MFVREMCYKNINSLKSMLKFIFNHNTQCKNIKLMAPITDSIRFILSNLKDNEISLKPFMMGRVINVEDFLNDIYIKHKDLDSVYIKIDDNQIKENDNVFEVKILNNKIVAKKSNSEADFKLSINNLSQMAFEYTDINQILFVENIEVTDKNKKAIDLLNSI
ncbi:sterol carrier protein domain-containing protein, partial [Paraclostridium bifermentans]|uniref:sterol carrier protein domain-containing protein n=3 Tax=Peptostreptococcaceae TaxID=186804 RepID=UPI0022E992F2